MGGDPRITPVKKNCLRDPDWTEITDQNFRDHPDWYEKTGTLVVNNEEITFYDLTF